MKSSERKTSPFNTFWYIRLGDGGITSKVRAILCVCVFFVVFVAAAMYCFDFGLRGQVKVSKRPFSLATRQQGVLL